MKHFSGCSKYWESKNKFTCMKLPLQERYNEHVGFILFLFDLLSW